MLWEKVVGYVFLFLVLGLVAYLVIYNPSLKPDIALFFKIVLALACAIAASSLLSGFLGLEWNVQGLALRAGGGFAVFALVLWKSPDVLDQLKQADIRMAPLRTVDFRTSVDPLDPTTKDRWLQGNTLLSADPITYEHLTERARQGRLVSESAVLGLGSTRATFKWLYFVHINPAATGWLGIQSDAHALTFAAGQAEAHTTLFRPNQELPWKDFIDRLKDTTGDFTITVTADLSGLKTDSGDMEQISRTCNVDYDKTKNSLAKYMMNNGYPHYFEVECLNN
jgi:hypothetical protein